MTETPQDGGRSPLHTVMVTAVAIYVMFSLFFSYRQYERINALEARQNAAEEQLAKKVAGVETRAQQVGESLSQQVGETQKQFAARSAELQRQQRASAEKLSEEQQKQQQALGQVTGQVAGVQSDVGGVKSDVAATRSDLEATKAKLERAIGDLGVQSGLIATTRDQLDVLKHKGDRNYYDFTLSKSKKTTPVGNISLQLKKADAKKSRFTLNVVADDHTIEKKDRGLNEPMQFYSGKDHMLYELVVFNIEKDKVTGYLSTPKDAPQPFTK